MFGAYGLGRLVGSIDFCIWSLILLWERSSWLVYFCTAIIFLPKCKEHAIMFFYQHAVDLHSRAHLWKILLHKVNVLPFTELFPNFNFNGSWFHRDSGHMITLFWFGISPLFGLFVHLLSFFSQQAGIDLSINNMPQTLIKRYIQKTTYDQFNPFEHQLLSDSHYYFDTIFA